MDNNFTADDTIQTIIRWGRSHNQIRAILLTSTRAFPGSLIDLLSDYDVSLVVEDIHSFVIDHGWLNYFGYPYPQGLHQKVQAYIEKIKSFQKNVSG